MRRKTENNNTNVKTKKKEKRKNLARSRSAKPRRRRVREFCPTNSRVRRLDGRPGSRDEGTRTLRHTHAHTCARVFVCARKRNDALERRVHLHNKWERISFAAVVRYVRRARAAHPRLPRGHDVTARLANSDVKADRGAPVTCGRSEIVALRTSRLSRANALRQRESRGPVCARGKDAADGFLSPVTPAARCFRGRRVVYFRSDRNDAENNND